MARTRIIKPGFSLSGSKGRVSREARLLFVLLWTAVDDEGCANDNLPGLAALLFYPCDRGAATPLPGLAGRARARGLHRALRRRHDRPSARRQSARPSEPSVSQAQPDCLPRSANRRAIREFANRARNSRKRT
jgi:hypothetical protein